VILRFCHHCGRHYDPATGVRNRCGPCGRAYDQRHSVERRARNSARWQTARAEARKRDGERCQNCGSSERLQVHHIEPLSQGGDRYALSNLVTLCQPCHAEAGRGREGIVTRDSSHPSPGSRETNEKNSRGAPTKKTGRPGEVFIG
jgi:5-methylcytosine-specific restriction endonuclease McrA